MSIAASFARLLEETAVTAIDDTAFDKHQRRLEAGLRARFNVAKVARVGSYARGSATSVGSDLDLLTVLSRDEVHWGGRTVASDTVLNRVREGLNTSFPSTVLGRDKQAIVVEFADGRKIDVVPAWYAGPLSDGWPLYRIPDGHGGWLETSPERHSKYIAEGDRRSGGKLKSVVRLLKHWKRARTPELPLSAFHHELLLSKEGVCNGARSISVCVTEALSQLAYRQCRSLQDPCGISGYIHAAATDAKRARLLAAVLTSAPRAAAAANAEMRGQVSEARRLWRLVFNGDFP